MSDFFNKLTSAAAKHGHADAIMESQLAGYLGAQGLAPGIGGLNAAVPEAQTFAGSDVSVIFLIPIDSGAARPDGNVPPYLETKDLQTITISSTSSLLPVRRIGEKKPISYSTGARTFAGSMIFTVINKDPLMELFSLDTLNQSATNDGSWHIDSMPPLDCAIVAQNETGGVAVQVIHGIRFTNWGTTYSIDDMYVESTYTYIAEHVTPFVISTLDAALLYGTIAKALVGADGVVRRGTSEGRAMEYLNQWRTLNQVQLAKYSEIKLPAGTPLDAVSTPPPGTMREIEWRTPAERIEAVLMSVTGGNAISKGVSAFASLTMSNQYSLDDRVWY